MSTEHTDAELLRAKGLRVTAQRLAVLESVRQRSHMDADRIFAEVRESLPGTSIQAVYIVLAALTKSGILRRFEPAGCSARYERRVADNHHHLVCRECGAIEDVDCVIGQAPCLEPGDTQGFRVQEAEVTFYGTCAACVNAESASEADHE